MDLVMLVLTLVVIGFLTWLLTEKVPMHAYVKLAIQLLVIIAMVLFVFRQLGVTIPNVLGR